MGGFEKPRWLTSGDKALAVRYHLRMGTLVIRNLPDVLHERLKALAKRNHRSLNMEAVAIIERQLVESREPLELSPALKLKGKPLSIKEIEAAIAGGRD